MATGLYQTPKIPALSGDFPANIKQLHSDTYRNPQQLLPGAVLVVGSAQSGAQIAEELHESGRRVYLAVGRAGRTPRRYRDKDANWWFARLGQYDRKVSELPSPKAKFAGKPHISGTRGGHTINLHQFARDGVVLFGRLAGIEDGIIELAGDLHDNLTAADRAEAEFIKSVDAYVARTGMTVPEEMLPALRDGLAQPMLAELDLKAAGITNVIWATGYSFDFSTIKLPVVDGDGFPIQTRGVCAYDGLFFVGLPWLHTAKSGLIYGVGEDASYIADRIAERGLPRKDARAVATQRSAASRANESTAMTRTADRLMTLIWWSALSLVLEGFAHTPSALAQPPRPTRPTRPIVVSRRRTRRRRQDDGALPRRAGEHLPREENPRLQMELTVKRKVIAMAAAAAIGLTITAARAFHDFNATSPRIDFLATPARQLHLGMTAQDVTRVMGDAPRETIFAAEGANMRRLEFPGAIPSKVTLTDGRLSRVTLDAFRVDKGDLPAYSHKAWPGMAASAVRRVLGEPADVLHHTLFGINVDQWVYSRAGLADLSMFFRADRVVARAVGREVPADLFVVDLPSPPEAKSEGPMSTPHLGLTASDMQEIYGEAKFRVDYVFNGQPASRVVFETGAKGTFACITFVDGVVTEFENLGQMPDDASFLGR